MRVFALALGDASQDVDRVASVDCHAELGHLERQIPLEDLPVALLRVPLLDRVEQLERRDPAEQVHRGVALEARAGERGRNGHLSDVDPLFLLRLVLFG